MQIRSKLPAILMCLVALCCITVPSTSFAGNGEGQVSVLKKKKKSKGRGQAKKKIKAGGLKAVPNSAKMLAAAKRGSQGGQSIHDVSGTPPALVDIPFLEEGIKNVFWKDGVIDGIISGSPTQSQCSQFHSGSEDGDSGGLGACHMAESVGHSFQLILESGASLCYMKEIPTQSNLDAGGISLDIGELPDGDVTKLFTAPQGSDSRLVKVNISGFEGGGEEGPAQETGFIKVYGSEQNQAAGNLYKVDLWFCTPDSEQATGSEQIAISNAGRLSSVSIHDDSQSDGPGGIFTATTEGFLTIDSNGEVTFDPTKSRSATAVRESDESGFKSEIRLTPNNRVETKFYDTFGGSSNKGYAVTRFSGSNIDAVRFLEGVFKGQYDEGEEFIGTSEYRNSYYAAAPNNNLKSALNAVDISSNEFYQTPPTSDADLSIYDCNAVPDIEVSIDMTNPTVMESVVDCEQRLDGMHFCHEDDDVSMADQMYFEVCSGEQDPGEGGPEDGGPGDGGPGDGPGEDGP